MKPMCSVRSFVGLAFAAATPFACAINYGAGARWYTYDHLAFTLDLRFYATQPTPATANTAPRLRHAVFVMSAGVSIK